MTNLLIVEDEHIMLKMWEKLLSNWQPSPSLQAHLFSCPFKAYDHLKEKGGDILLTDYQLPLMTGHELILKALKILPDLRVILTTCYMANPRIYKTPNSFIHLVKKPYTDIEQLKEFLSLFIQDSNEISHRETDTPLDGVYIWDL